MKKYSEESEKNFSAEMLLKGEQFLRDWLELLQKEGMPQKKLTSYLRCGLAHLCYDFVEFTYEFILTENIIPKALISFKNRKFHEARFVKSSSKKKLSPKKKGIEKKIAKKSKAKKSSSKKAASKMTSTKKENKKECKKNYKKEEGFMKDIIIIGAGPAGLSASIYGIRAGLDLSIVEKFSPGGQVINTFEVENYPGFVEPIAGWELMSNMENQARRLGVEILSGEVKSINKEKDAGNFKIEQTSGAILEARSVIAATGATFRKLKVPGEEKFIGKESLSAPPVMEPFIRIKLPPL